MDAAPVSADEALQRARRWFDGGPVGDAWLRAHAELAVPIPVTEADDRLHGWFVAVIVADRLAAFMQLRADGAPLRFASFQRRSGDVADCPPAADWLDTAQIARRAAHAARPGEFAGPPRLSYDGAPDRLAWRVPLQSADGSVRELMVAGAAVFEPRRAA